MTTPPLPAASVPSRRRTPAAAPDADARALEYLRTLNGLGRGFWNAAVLHAAMTLGVFSALGHATRPAAAIAAEIGCDARYLDSLLLACVTLGLVERSRRGYRNTPLARMLLLPGQPLYQGDMVLHRHDIWANWGRLAEAVKTGAPLPLHLPTPEERFRFTRTYLMSHDNIAASGQAQGFIASVPLPARGHLLDVGGGAASYAIAACSAHRGLTATVIELPEAAEVARDQIESAGLGDRISVLAGDYIALEFPPADVVLFSAVLCQESRENRDLLLHKAYAALAPGGLLVVQDALRMPEQDAKANLMALFDVLVLMLYHADGGVFTGDEVARWLRGAGFGPARQKPLPGLFSIVYARRPQER